MKTVLMVGLLLFNWRSLQAQQQMPIIKTNTMRMNAGIVTAKLTESKKFYTENLGFGVTFENDFYLLLHTPGHKAEISFLLPDHASQQPLFHRAFGGSGVYLTLEVDDVDVWYDRLRKKEVPILVQLRDEPWGDRHFAIRDPNGVAIDIVKYAPSQAND